jgi:hypothetical protein
MLNDVNRKKLDDIVAQMASQNAPAEDVRAVVDDFKVKYDTPEPVKQPEVKQKKPEVTQTEKYGVAGALFPATTESTERGGGFVPRMIAGAGDALTFPARTVSAVATGAGTLAGGGSLSTATKEAANDLSRTKSTEDGAIGFVQDMALDPTSSPLLAGTGVAAKAIKVAPTIGKAIAKIAASGAAYGAGSGAYQQSKSGEVSAPQTIGQAVLGAGVGAGSTGLGKAVQSGAGKLLKNTAIRNIDISLRPGQYGRKIGYNHENVVKHDLIGSPRETYEKATEKLSSLQTAAKEIAKDSDATFDIKKMFDDEINSIDPKDNPKYYLKKVKELTDTRDAYIGAYGEVVDAPTVMKIRTEIGKESAFVGRSLGGNKIDPDANWKEDAYSNLYLRFKNKIHEDLGGELKEINKAQNEIIPVMQVAERRIPISESNQRVGLSDLLTAGVGTGIGAGASTLQGDETGGRVAKGILIGAALAGGRRALGSPVATKAFYKAGQAIAPKAKVSPTVVNPETEIRVDLPPDVNTPAYFRKGIDVEGSIDADNALRISERAKKYRVTPEQYQKIESDLRAEEAALLAEKEVADKIKEAALETDIYMENLPKRLVLTPEDFKGEVASRKMRAGKVAKKTKDNQPGEISAWHVLGNKPTIGESISPKKPGILGNERGAVGGVSDEFVGTPAIRDPETGKIYLGGWRGHKDAIIKGETSAIQERLKYQHFLDNSNKPTDNVGFIDKKGNFVSRREAEQEIAKPKTPAQLYHGDEWGKAGAKGDKYSALKTLAATGATAAGGLTIGEYLKAKKKK